LRYIIRTGFLASATALTQASLFIYNYYAVFFPFGNGSGGAGGYAEWLSAMMAEAGKKADIQIRELTPLRGSYFYPEG